MLLSRTAGGSGGQCTGPPALINVLNLWAAKGRRKPFASFFLWAPAAPIIAEKPEPTYCTTEVEVLLSFLKTSSV